MDGTVPTLERLLLNTPSGIAEDSIGRFGCRMGGNVPGREDRRPVDHRGVRVPYQLPRVASNLFSHQDLCSNETQYNHPDSDRQHDVRQQEGRNPFPLVDRPVEGSMEMVYDEMK